MRAIIITTIHNPSEAIIEFAKKTGYELIVVGDKKTPKDWYCDGVDFVSVEDQDNLGFSLTEKLPYNHYCRKMLGYLKAISAGADIIIDTDDDNIPKADWEFPPFEGVYGTVPGGKGFVNVYQIFSNQHIWPRGLPLDLIRKKFQLDTTLSLQECKVGIWQGLADEDPDVDAIYRLTSDEPCYFDQHDPVVLEIGTVCPFNTQNTAIRKELFSLLYLPTHVTFRFTDILRGLIAQPIMWLYGYQLGFVGATVIQKRNEHDYYKDFISEIPMYMSSNDILEIVGTSVSVTDSIESNIYNAYYALSKKQIVCDEEIKSLEMWLSDLTK